MKNPILEIKEALIPLIKSLDPSVDVLFEEIKGTDELHGLTVPLTWYFVDLRPGTSVTVDGIYTDMNVVVDIAYHEPSESNTEYLIKSAEIDAAIRPVFVFAGRKITIEESEINVVDHVLHYIFNLKFRCSREEKAVGDLMENLDVAIKESEN